MIRTVRTISISAALALLLLGCTDPDPAAPSTTRPPATTTTAPAVPTTTNPPVTTEVPVVTTTLPPVPQAPVPPVPADPPAPPKPEAVYYANCDAVQAAGAAPLYRGEPGYRTALDRDGDGVACENQP